MTYDQIDKILTQWRDETPDLDLSSLAVIGRILQLARLLEKHRETVLADFDLNLWSFDMLATLRRQGPPYQLKPTELYGLLMLSSGAMTNRIDRLEKAGWVTRLRDPDDRRSVIVQLTNQGMEYVDTVMPVLFERENRLLDDLSQAETATLITLLRKFLDTMSR
ncbi:transcriptional regulator [Leptolyngbya sp. Heron Island J]|uniref:MarR family winged helix-turn-helix transcriptional regulator n=1 Tax=Leptolyngbya sp. Heron Island J TaxID=1385935 RepID=UPI0003B9EF61|nr:MarR family transcriptional regulator [Leptolyngbya sp. Heron Island J]ESA37400.1 transcriptional regulator [Leptolyngbya sp. Heron Island J]